MHIDTDTHQAPWHRAFVFIATSHKSSMWPAIAHGHAKSLCSADTNISTPFARRCQQCQCQQICRHDECRLLAVCSNHIGTQIIDATTGRGVLR